MPDQSSAATEHAILAEITRPLEALPDDPLSVVNADFPMALRGYDRVAVDEYVRRTRQLVAELQATRSPEAAVRRALERVGEEITGILQRAHETAEQITVQSRSDAEDRLEQARQEAEHIAAGAEQRVRELDADTDRIWLERQRIVADAEELAAQLLALSKTAAERFPADGESGAGPAADYDQDENEDEPRPQEAPLADEDDEDDDDIAYHDAEAEAGEDVRAEPSDVEATVAFETPPPSEDATADGHPTSDDTTADGHPSSDDTTAVIPPASQAANRRRPQ